MNTEAVQLAAQLMLVREVSTEYWLVLHFATHPESEMILAVGSCLSSMRKLKYFPRLEESHRLLELAEEMLNQLMWQSVCEDR